MDEKEFDLIRDRYGLVTSDTYKAIRTNQLDMIVGYSANCEPLELRGMLKLIKKTDEWRDEFLKVKEKRK